jgi:hypothetical protein
MQGGSSRLGPGTRVSAAERDDRIHVFVAARLVIALATGVSRRSERDGRRGGEPYLHRFAWTNIVRHQIVKHEAAPDDPALAGYWAWRRRKAPYRSTTPPCDSTKSRTYAICRATLIAVEDRPQTPREWETWLATAPKTIDVIWDQRSTDTAEPRLVHLHCHHG